MYCFEGNGISCELNKRTYIMGILNVTPDSFFDGGKYNIPKTAAQRAAEMELEGADIIDLGAQSTGPDSVKLSCEEELRRLKQFLIPVLNAVSVPVSVDTFYPETAEYCLENGAKIINDVSGTVNPEIAETVKKYNAGWVITHNPSSACEVCDYSASGGAVNAVSSFFETAEKTVESFNIKPQNICYDMGIGFGKSHSDNIELIKNINLLKRENRALLTALSCKRVTGVNTGAQGDDRLFTTLAANTLAIAGKTDFIRVHHVKQAVLAAKMADEIVR